MLQSGKSEAHEAEENRQVELDVRHGDLVADDAEEREEDDAEDKAGKGDLAVEDEIKDAVNLHRLIDDLRDDVHALLHDERRIGHSRLGCRRIPADERTDLRQTVQRKIADEITPAEEQDAAETVEESATHDPWE